MSSATEIDPKFEELLEYLRTSRGFDFTGYKRSTLMRRAMKRLEHTGAEDFGTYLEHLEAHPEEFEHLFNTILINVTGFFRDTLAWEYLADKVIPAILERAGDTDPIRVWSAGCASGEEAYSLAMLFAEAVGPGEAAARVRIYATDVDEEALAQARQGAYTEKELESVPEELRKKYFEPVNAKYQFSYDLRRAMIFGRHDLVQDPPISKLHLLACRNALMYFNAETQARILNRLHFALRGDGFLFLGKAEMLLTHADLFTPVESKMRVFRRVGDLEVPGRQFGLVDKDEISAVQKMDTELDGLAANAIPVAQITIDVKKRLRLANREARILFGIAPKHLGRPFSETEISYRPVELRSQIETVVKSLRPLSVKGIEWRDQDGKARFFDVDVVPLMDKRNELAGVCITFTDVSRLEELQKDLDRARTDLETAYEELQSTNEELTTTNEELHSTVEELETTNEELQSTNEELETMNAELQSTNEELVTGNEQLRERDGEVMMANRLLQSILTGLTSAVVVLDEKACVMTWAPQAQELWGLTFDDVRGRSFFSLDIGLPVKELQGVIRTSLNEGSKAESVELDAINRRGKAIRCRITCSPLAGSPERGKGVILYMEEVEGGGRA